VWLVLVGGITYSEQVDVDRYQRRQIREQQRCLLASDNLSLQHRLHKHLCGVWCVVCGVWCVVCGVWCVVPLHRCELLDPMDSECVRESMRVCCHIHRPEYEDHEHIDVLFEASLPSIRDEETPS
jgi:hypothetical protein